MKNVRVTVDRTAAVKTALKALVQDRVLVGIASEHAFRDPDDEDSTPHLNNAEIGYLNEFGAPDANIPARPHLVPGTQSALPKVEKIYREAFAKAVVGDVKGIRDAHAKVGQIAADAVRGLIQDGISPPLAERTLQARKKRGVTRTTPLVDGGEYRKNINYAVRAAKGVKVIS